MSDIVRPRYMAPSSLIPALEELNPGAKFELEKGANWNRILAIGVSIDDIKLPKEFSTVEKVSEDVLYISNKNFYENQLGHYPVRLYFVSF